MWESEGVGEGARAQKGARSTRWHTTKEVESLPLYIHVVWK